MNLVKQFLEKLGKDKDQLNEMTKKSLERVEKAIGYKVNEELLEFFEKENKKMADLLGKFTNTKEEDIYYKAYYSITKAYIIYINKKINNKREATKLLSNRINKN